MSALVRLEMVDAGTHRMAWRRLGAGRPLVLLHGGHGNWLHWARNIERLAIYREVWVPDLPGYGDSGDAGNAGGLADIVDPTVATLNQLVGRSTSIDMAGFSFGGLVATLLAMQRGGVDRLALLGPAGHGGARRPRGKLQNWKGAAQAEDGLALASAMRHNLAVHMLHTRAEAIDPLAVAIHTQACVHTRFRSKDISQASGLVEALAQRQQPTLILVGEHDVTIDPLQLQRAFDHHDPRIRVRVIDGVGHWVQYEGSDGVNAELSAWLMKALP